MLTLRYTRSLHDEIKVVVCLGLVQTCNVIEFFELDAVTDGIIIRGLMPVVLSLVVSLIVSSNIEIVSSRNVVLNRNPGTGRLYDGSSQTNYG